VLDLLFPITLIDVKLRIFPCNHGGFLSKEFALESSEDNRRNTRIFREMSFVDKMVNGHLEITGHGGDRFFHILAKCDKERIDEIINSQS
jgi:hypothetical protein